MISPLDFGQLLTSASTGLLMNIDEKNPFRFMLWANDDAWHQIPMMRFALMNRTFLSETRSGSPWLCGESNPLG